MARLQPHQAGFLHQNEEEVDQLRLIPGRPSIQRIVVRELFGRLSFDIPNDEGGQGFGRLVLLYGDNGSGKTTLLNIVFHLLSSARNKGHLTFLANTPFKSISIYLYDNTLIRAFRDDRAVYGAFSLEVLRDDSSVLAIEVAPNEDGRVLRSENEDYDRLSDILESLDVYPYYLSDTREFVSDMFSDDADEDIVLRNAEYHRYWSYLRRSGRRDVLLNPSVDLPTSLRRNRELLLAVDRAERWLQQQAYSAANTGMASANNVYIQILEQLATAPHTDAQVEDSEYFGVRDQLVTFAERDKEYARFGLGVQFPTERFLSLLDHAPAERRHLLSSVLKQHLQSSEAQLDAIQDLFNLVSVFTNSINNFLSNKQIRFSAKRRGLSVFTSDGNELSPIGLSSGERQLLLLLCNVLIARDVSRLFIIDEPEISLNIKWQRALIDVLLELTDGTDVQFFIATHSIEMVAQHMTNLIKLEV